MGWPSIVVLAAGIGSMTAALEKGDVDEASRQGVLAGPAVIEQALASKDRTTVLAGIAAAPSVEDRAELLEPLAKLAKGADRRVAIPAARAAARIAREMSGRDVPDDIADADLVAWRDDFAQIALDRDRWIDVRVLAVDVAGYVEDARALAMTAAPGLQRVPLDPARADGVGVSLTAALADADPALRRAVLAHVPSPVPPELRDTLATAIEKDIDPLVALGAANVVCADLAFDPAAPILAALGDAGIERIQVVVTTPGASRGALKEAARCLAADKSPASLAALRKIRNR